jgi:hypothetical protein
MQVNHLAAASDGHSDLRRLDCVGLHLLAEADEIGDRLTVDAEDAVARLHARERRWLAGDHGGSHRGGGRQLQAELGQILADRQPGWQLVQRQGELTLPTVAVAHGQ